MSYSKSYPRSITRHRIKAEFAEQEARRMPRTIESINPLEGGGRFMTMKRAMDFVRRGVAKIENGKLLFTRENQIQLQEEVDFRNNRNGYYWNGSSKDPRATYKPGKIRS
jgi:hypothetical protein